MSTPRRPPVNEVVLSIAFDRNEALAGPLLGVVLGKLLDEFPNIEQQPQYQIPPEFPPGKVPPGAMAPTVQFTFSPQPPEPRYWLISQDEIELVQVQPDFLAFNWRRRSADQVYPGYEQLASKFAALRDRVASAVSAVGKQPIRPTRAEVTYINIISPDENWSTYSEMSGVVQVSFPDLPRAEQYGLAYSRVIESAEGSFAGRVHVNVQPAIDTTTGGPVINITATARSVDLDPRDEESADNFLNSAHEVITESFRSLTTDEARRTWGIS